MRGVALLGSSLFFISGLRFLPIAEASATGFVAPLFVTALSIVFLGEKVGVRRWLATAIGLIGVLIILRPGIERVSCRRVLPARLGAGLGLHPDHDAHDERQGTRHHHHDLFVDRGRLHPVGAGAVRLGRRRAGTTSCSASSSASPRPRGSGSSCWRFAMPTPRCWRRFPTPSCCGSASSASSMFGEVPDIWTVIGAVVHRRQRSLYRAPRARPALAASGADRRAVAERLMAVPISASRAIRGERPW